MATPIRERIILELDYHLSRLTTANGFNTNAGANMERARKKWDESDPDCLSYFPETETAARVVGGKETMTMPFKVDLLTTYASTETAGAKGEKALADLRECMHSVLKNPEGTLADDIIYKSGGVEEYPELSQKIVGITASFDVIYKTKIGDPYNQ